MLRDRQTYLPSRGAGLTDVAHEEPWRPPGLLLEADPPGTGVHQCVGRPVARLEVELDLGALARRPVRLEPGGDPVPVRVLPVGA